MRGTEASEGHRKRVRAERDGEKIKKKKGVRVREAKRKREIHVRYLN